MSAVPARRSSMAPAVTAPAPAPEGAPQHAELRPADPARPPGRRDGPAGGRARLVGHRRPPRLPARRGLAPHLLRLVRRSRRLLRRRPSGGLRPAGRPRCRRRSPRRGPSGRTVRSPTVQALLGAWEADRVLAHLCLVSCGQRQRRDHGAASHGDRADRRVAGRRAAQPLAAEPVLAGAIGSVWELALARA